MELSIYFLSDSSNEDSLVVQQFIRKYLSIINEGGARLPIRYMSEYFVFLHDFARNGIDECYLITRLFMYSTINHILYVTSWSTTETIIIK